MQPSTKPRLPRFGLWTMMLVMFVCAVTASVGSYLIKAIQDPSGPATEEISPKGIFIMFALVAPMAMLLLVSAFYQIDRFKKSRRKKNKKRFRQP